MRGALVAVAGLMGLTLLGCKGPPEDIAPVQVSALKYQRMDCRALTVQIAEMDQRLADLYARQRMAQTNDLYKSLYFLHPRASIVGPDMEPTIALAKGERYAANAVFSARC